jgi:DNA topoisomerase IA
MTAQWEEKLEEIYRKGLNYKGYTQFLENIKRFTSKEVERLKTSKSRENEII